MVDWVTFGRQLLLLTGLPPQPRIFCTPNIFAIPMVPYPTYLQYHWRLTQHICNALGSLPNIFATPLVPYPTYLQYSWCLTQHICNTIGALPNTFAMPLGSLPNTLFYTPYYFIFYYKVKKRNTIRLLILISPFPTYSQK